MPPPTTVAGKLVLDECLKLNKALNYRIGDFKALADLRKNFAETARLRSQVVAASQGLKDAKQATKETAALYKDLNKRAKEIGKTANESKKLWDRFLSKIPGGNSLGKVAAAGGLIAALLQIAVIAALQVIQQQLNNLNIDNINKLIDEIQPIATQSINNKIEIKGLQKREQQRIVEINDIKEEIHLAGVNAANLRKQINDALYEVRKGREIVESKIVEAKKIGNDALYEVRQGRKILEDKINSINSKVSEVFNTVSTSLQSKINAVIDPIKATLSTNKAEIEALKTKVNQTSKPIDSQAITKQAVDASLAAVGSKLAQVNQDNYSQNIRIDTVSNALNALGGQLGNINNRINLIEKTPIKIPPQKNYDADISSINNRLREQERVNASALPKLDQILGFLPLIPARAAGLINPNIPTKSDLENAAATGTCRTTQPGGCSRKMIDDAIGNINGNTNNKANNILNAVNLGANGAELALLGVINNKLGDQVPGGITGKLKRISDWLQLDKVLAVLTFAATVHNAVQLSNDIGVTLGTALSNVLSVVGIKNDEGNPIDIGAIINSSVENMVKGIIGVENYTQFTTTWAKANRIYQATINAANAFTNIGHTIVNGLEVVGGMQGKIGNALRAWGVVAENAYQWFNPQPNYHSRMFKFFENAQQGASTIAMVTQVPIDITNAVTEFNNSTTELIKATKEDPGTPNKGVASEEAQLVKADFESLVNSSISPEILTTDYRKPNA